ncbi:hypothetical protein ACFWNC_17445 [Streptomyces sp. NPDC058369]|uniref:hypothetical protein n=1 Tax=Streptomyces sp. NPDC058369 TaxID=3346462 RepID=UPI003652B335
MLGPVRGLRPGAQHRLRTLRRGGRVLAGHLAYDRHYVAGHLLRHHLSDEVRDADFLRAWLAGDRPDGTAPEAAALLDRHAPAALVLDGFHRRLLTESRRTPSPSAAIDRAAGR